MLNRVLLRNPLMATGNPNPTGGQVRAKAPRKMDFRKRVGQDIFEHIMCDEDAIRIGYLMGSIGKRAQESQVVYRESVSSDS